MTSTCRPSTAAKKAGERYECSERLGSGAARSLERDRHPAAGGREDFGSGDRSRGRANAVARYFFFTKENFSAGIHYILKELKV